MYQASRTQPMTATARHLDRVMRERDWSRVRLFEEVGADLGYRPKSRSAFLRLLDDKEPTAEQAAVLVRHFGQPDPLPDTKKQPGGDATGLFEALTAALLAQAESLTAIRLTLSEATRTAAEERQETARLIGDLSDQLDELRGLVGSTFASSGPPSSHLS